MAKLCVSGLTNCDSCRKARRALAEAGHDVTFRDLRETPLSPEEILELWQEFGDALLNRASTTWRGLDAAEQAQPAADLLRRHPALIKRPLIDDGGKRTLGWAPTAQKHWLG